MATFNIKCGVCGQDMTVEPDVSEDYGLVLLATCPGCKCLDEINFDLARELGRRVQKAWGERATNEN